jgi:hypothetical protein
MLGKGVAARVTVLLLPLLLAGAPSGSKACGFHDPTQLAQAAIAMIYPDAFHVSGAIWSAQKSGVIAMPDRERLQARGPHRQRLDKLAFFNALKSLNTLGSALDKAATGGERFDMALVLIETVLWTRYANGSDGLDVQAHTEWPEDGDFVIVTDEPVLHAIVQGKLSVKRAVELGLMRLYGPDEKKNLLLAQFGSIGDEPLRAPQATNLFGGLAKTKSSNRRPEVFGNTAKTQ